MNFITSQERELIQKYYLKQLSDSEKIVFQNKLEKSATFKEEVALVGALQTTLAREEGDVLKKILKQEEQKYSQVSQLKTNSKSNNWYWLLVVIIMAFCAFLWWKMYYSKPSNPQYIYAAYFEPYPNTLVMQDRNAQDTNTAQRAFQSYEAEQYQDAWGQFKQLAPSEESDIIFYQAITALAIKKYDNAIPLLQKVLKNPNSRYHQQAKWYLALSFLMDNQKETAILLLKEMDQSDKTYRQNEAHEILIKIGGL